MDIAIIGMGRLGRTVSKLLNKKNVQHKQVTRKTPLPKADLYYLTVPDREIKTVASQLKNGIVLHASGTCDHSILRPRQPAGVLHPIMSFPGPEINTPNPPIPASVAGDPEAVTAANELGELLGFSCFEYHGDRRLYHAAAVMAGNFSSVLMHLAASLLKDSGLNMSQAIQLLSPLAIQSIQQANAGMLEQILTGPISREDTSVIKMHVDALENTYPHISEAYKNLVNTTFQHLKLEKDLNFFE